MKIGSFNWLRFKKKIYSLRSARLPALIMGMKKGESMSKIYSREFIIPRKFFSKLVPNMRMFYSQTHFPGIFFAYLETNML